jgi:hypothetical protein
MKNSIKGFLEKEGNLIEKLTDTFAGDTNALFDAFETPKKLEQVSSKSFTDYLIEGANKLKNLKFPEDGFLKCDTNYWYIMSEVAEDNTSYKAFFRIKENVSPTEAIESLFDTNTSMYQIDCARFVQFLMSYAKMKTMNNKKKFDALYKTILEVKTHEASTHKIYNEFEFNSESGNYSSLYDNIIYKNEPELLDAMPLGSVIVLRNTDENVDESEPFKHENCVKIGDDLFIAHGFGTEKMFSLQKVKDNLANTGGSSIDKIILSTTITYV